MREQDPTARMQEWAATDPGFGEGDFRSAHADSHAKIGSVRTLLRPEREHLEDLQLAPGATRAQGAGNRAIPEKADEYRTCFERDLDRIKHSKPWRRLARKTQVFIFPEDHQRSRMTHAIEVAQIAKSVAQALRLNVALTEAIALGHDCGHGPGGHASEDALSQYIPGGYDHAVWGADVTLQSENLCEETLDGIRNHSWSRPAPSTPEGEVVSWADRIAYLCHDFEDAVSGGIVQPSELPQIVREVCGSTRSKQLSVFVNQLITVSASAGQVGMDAEHADALGAFRAFNYEHIYTRPESQFQAELVIQMLRALTDFFIDRPDLMQDGTETAAQLEPHSDTATHEAVNYVGGMTDQYASKLTVEILGWDPSRLPGFIMKGPLDDPREQFREDAMFTDNNEPVA